MKSILYTLIISFVTLTCISLVQAMQTSRAIGVDRTLTFFKERTAALQLSLHQLAADLEALDPKKSNSLPATIKALQKARIQYKTVEFFVEYFINRTAAVYNRPASYEIDAAGLEYEEPVGLQVIEDILINGKPYAEKDKLLLQSEVLTSSVDDLTSLLHNLIITDAQILESIRLELIRIATLGITGYDAPFLKSGITESAAALNAVTQVLQPFLTAAPPMLADSLRTAITTASRLLKSNPLFDAFDRLEFYTKGMAPLQQSLSQLIRQLNLDLNTTGAINYNAATIFSPDFLNKPHFLPLKKFPSEAEIALGKRLFFDKGLSENGQRSCATCHQPQKYFTDGFKTNISLSGVAIRRNSPSLFYTVYQYAQFLDGRENSLEDQARKVITNTTEMAGNPHQIISLLKESVVYPSLFKTAFPQEEEPLHFETIARAIAAYETTLTPFNSAFDRYMAGDKKALTKQQQAGFNLFTGKAQCATCHFVPLFNGLTPPAYANTEFEILGVPATADFKKPVADKDSGRYHAVPLPYTISSFKTPTVRNAAMTAPYMHNGSLSSLEQVMDFYNRGGGEGIGLKMQYQTLSSGNLKLTPSEIKAVISFLHSLTDKADQ